MLKGFVSGEEKDIIRIPMKGKNLISLPTTSKTINGVEWTCTGGIISGNGLTTSLSYQDCVVITPSEITRSGNYPSYYSINTTHGIKLPAGTYTFSADYVYGANASRLRLVVGREGTTPRYNTASEIFSGDTFTTDGEDYAVLVCGDINTVSKVEFKNIMLNAGSTALPYEPYGYQNGWEVRDNQNRIIWGREDELQTTTGTLPFKGYDLPVKVKSLLGNAVQNGTPSPDSPVIPEMCGVRTENLAPPLTKWVDGYVASNGNIAPPGDVYKEKSSDYISIKAGGSYVFSIENGFPNDPWRAIGWYSQDKTFISRASGKSSNALSTNAPSNAVYCRLSYRTQGETTNSMFNKGSTALPYEPYGYKITFKNNGENLFNTEDETNRKYLTSDGSEASNAAYSYTTYIPVIGNEKYTISKTSTQNSTACHCWYDVDKQFISSDMISQTTVTLTAPTSAAFLRCSYRKETVPEVMLNLGSTALPYSPYLNKTTPIYLGEVPTIRRIKKRVFNGTENWTLWVYETIAMFYIPVADGTGNQVMSSHFGTRKTGSMPIAGCIAYNGDSNKNMIFRMLDNTSITTVEDFKAWLAAQYAAGTPVTVWYILAEPETGIVNEPLAKIGDYADELTEISVHGLSAPLYGIEDYKNILNLSTGVVTGKIKELVLTGEETWFIYSTNFPSHFITYTISDRKQGIIPYCTHYEGSTATNYTGLRNGHVSVSTSPSSNGRPRTTIHDNRFLTIVDFKSYLATQYANGTPVTIWYVLETPETETVTVPTGMTGEIEGYLTQISTPTPEHPSIPKWNGEEETGGTYSVTVYNLPEISTTTGQNTLTVDTTLAPYKVTINGHIKYTYWGKIREDVRSGLAQTKFPVGTILYDNEDETTGRAFQVVGYDKHFDPSLTARGYNHSMTLCQLKLSGPWQFDATEAFLYTTVEMQPGTYKFKIPNYDATYGGNKTYYFTSTASVPVDSQITLSWAYQQPPKTVTAYAGPNPQTNTTAITGFNALQLSEWIEGESPEAIDLGTIKLANNDPDSAYGKLNHIHRAKYGSNNYYQSGLRQLLNTDLASNNWWHPTTIFDRPYANRTTNGYLRSLNEDFINVLATPEITHIANNIFEYPSLDGRTFTLNTEYKINTDKVFLLSHTEVGLSASPNIGTVLDYYSTHNTNNDRIKYRIDNGNAYHWWFRTPYPTDASSFRLCFTSGALYVNGACLNLGVAPAHIIQ